MLCHAVEFVLLHSAQDRGSAIRGGGNNDEVSEAFEQVFDETARVLPGLDDPVDGFEGRGGVAGSQGFDHFAEQGAMRVSEQGHRTLVLHRRSFGACDELVEQGEGISHGTATGSHDEWEHTGLDLHLLAVRELLHVFEHLGGRHESERVVVGARPDGADDFFGFGGGEDELDVFRRLFDDLEERVESLRGDHVRFVEDKDLVAVAGRCEDGTLAKVAGVVYTVVACGVDLDDIQRSAAVTGEFDTGCADTAWGVRWAFSAVEAAGENAGGCRLAAPTGSAKEVCVVDPVVAQRGAERIGHLRLPDQLGERLWPIAAIQCGDHPSRIVGAADSVGRVHNASHEMNVTAVA